MGTLLLASAGATEAVAAAATTAMLPSRKMRRPTLLFGVPGPPRHVIGVKRKAEVKPITKNMVKSFIVECNNWELVVRITTLDDGDEPEMIVL